MCQNVTPNTVELKGFIRMTKEELKQAVAKAAVEYIRPKLTPKSIIGVGTGSTANYFIDYLASIKDLFDGTVSSSEATAGRLQQHGMPVYNLNSIEELVVYVDGADESDHTLCLIKGGGAAHTREKIVAAVANEFICIADDSKWVKTLGAFPLPVEVIPMARAHVSRQLLKLGGTPEFRAGVITDNGNEILDVHNLDIHDPIKMEADINQIVGVVANGLFAQRPADVLLLGKEKGVETIKRP